MSMSRPSFATKALPLYKKGYNIVPVLPGQKRVVIPNWSSTTRNTEQLRHWLKTMPNHGVGILTQQTPFVDVDVTNSSIAHKMQKFIFELLHEPDILMERIGQPPKFAIPFKLPEGFDPFTKLKSNVYIDVQSNKPQAVEILGDGQMCLAEGIHPDTKSPYTWFNLAAYHQPSKEQRSDLPDIQELPELSFNIIDAIFDEFHRLAAKKVSAGKWQLKHESAGQYPAMSRSHSTSIQQQTQQTKLTNPHTGPKVHYTKSEVESILDDIPELPHDEWLRIGIALHHQFQGSQVGEDLWIYYSKKYTTLFNAQEIKKRYPTFNKSTSNVSKPVTLATVIEYRNRALAKQEAPPVFNLTPILTSTQTSTHTNTHASTQASTKSSQPSKSSTQTSSQAQSPKWYDDWYFISSSNRLFNAVTNDYIKPEAFNFIYANEMVLLKEKGTASNYVSKLNLVPKMSGIAYMPGAARMFMQNNQKFVNSYNQFIPKGKKPDTYTPPTILIDFIQRTFPSDTERNILLDFMAHVVQNPGARVNWAPILLGIQGTGKTTILEIMTIVLGSTNAKPVSAELFTNSFNSYAEGSMFSFVEEIKISGDNRHKVLDKVKAIITNNVINITNKGVDSREITNVTSYMLGTNHADALPIDNDDRRYTVLQTVLDLAEQEFAKLYEFLRDEDNHHDIYHWLATYPISKAFNPRGRAPKTSATKSMVSNTEDFLIAKIQEAIDSNKPLLNQSLISFSVLKSAVSDDMASLTDKGLSSKIRSKLIQMNYTRCNEQHTYSINGTRHTLYRPNVNLQRQLKLPKDAFHVALEKALEEETHESE